MRAHRRRYHIVLAGLAATAMPLTMLGGAVLAGSAQAVSAPAARAHRPPDATAGARLIGVSSVRNLPAGQRRDCAGQATAGLAECMAVRKTTGAAAPKGLPPAALRSAYGLSKAAVKEGHGETVAIVTAYADPRAAADLAVYRNHFKLPGCTTATGCLRIVNEHGKARPLPSPNASWAQGEATELDAVSALCPECKLLVLEASSNSITDLGTANDSAVAAGARFVVNGWAAVESIGQDSYDGYFDHPGVAVVAAAGNNGYGRTFPGDLPYVTSVGGTTLSRTRFNTRGWTESAWADTNSGCSALEVRPSWQRSDTSPVTGCPNRTQNDVSADANPGTGVAVYDSYGQSAKWTRQGGTALAAAIVTAAYALAGRPAPRTYPASYPYQHARDLHDVTTGSNGPCPDNPAYICTAGKGFDGPTGLGTPEGTGAFTAAGTDPVTLMDPGTQDAQAGAQIEFHITGLDSRSGGDLKYTASGLPAGLSIAPVAHSTNAVVLGNLPSTPGSYTVTVTGTDTKTHKAGTTRFLIVAAGSLTPASPPTTVIMTDTDQPNGTASECLDGGSQTAGAAVTVELCSETLQQNWTIVPVGSPGGPAEFVTDGLCLGLSDDALVLGTCDQAAASDSWYWLYNGLISNGATGTCLDTGSSQTGPLTLQPCDSSLAQQQWWTNQGTLQSAIPGLCVAGVVYPAPTYNSIQAEPCGQAGTDFTFSLYFDNEIDSAAGCVGAARQYLIGTSCSTAPDLALSWVPLPDGELLNQGTGLCMGDPGDVTTAGTELQLEPCYGALDELWSLS